MLDQLERYLGRIHLIHWLIGGVLAVIPSGFFAYWANASGMDRVVVFVAAIGGLVIGAVAVGLAWALYQFMLGRRLVPLQDALRMAYEQCEASVGSPGSFLSGFGGPEVELSPYFDAFASRSTPFFAQRSQSGRRLRIEGALGQFVRIPGTSDLAAAHARGTAIYVNVAIRSSEIRTAIRHWREQGIQFAHAG